MFSLRSRGARTLLQKRLFCSAISLKACWKCQETNELCVFFCTKCDAILPVENRKQCDAFKIFSLPRKYHIDLKAIEQTYWKLQKRLHPDLFGSKSQQLSATNSALVNDAYRTLKDPIRRIDMLLKLHGINALDETSNATIDPALLMETMEIRENIASASLSNLQALKNQVGNDISIILQKLQQTYDVERDLKATQTLMLRLQYLKKSMIEMEKREEQSHG